MTEEINDVQQALNTEISWLTDLLEAVENAETKSDLVSVYSDLRRYHDGDCPGQGSDWAEIRLKDYFRNRGMWDESQRWPDTDQISESESNNG